MHNIFDEKLLSTEGLEGRYSTVRDTLYFQRFVKFTRSRGPYIPIQVHKFYTTYRELVPKGKKKASSFNSVKSVIVRGKKVMSSGNHINIVLGRDLGDTKAYEGFLTIQFLNDSQAWLAQLIYPTKAKSTRATIQSRQEAHHDFPKD